MSGTVLRKSCILNGSKRDRVAWPAPAEGLYECFQLPATTHTCLSSDRQPCSISSPVLQPLIARLFCQLLWTMPIYLPAHSLPATPTSANLASLPL
ncbi:uncharacterized protein LOC105015694 isoform X2 [Esox lucius]|uniref:uncharacterized protein LOC105015694 isoform X2 n=1 Tax=Esox lucius TaxID=8010 RepID=UPI0010BD48E2|nr:uncharacterized protein LOC105015694 isoform X2 [Esox lucius]